MIYLDSSAVIKLIIPEPGSAEFAAYLEVTDQALVSSELLHVEIHRTLIKHGRPNEDHELAGSLLADITLLPLSPVLVAAARFPHRHLGSLAALHLATAVDMHATAFVTYDHTLGRAAEAEGITVVSP
ncbi:type II toxin-antitoxin system VapC family toxin [Gandjariella thermophila]|uniref:Ribonuclease VapC n=1 Tax=Gandjariella thermophila TaxID=1931992 RepID=A0A4D4J3I1_9PSEU|nr:type II toxin-antitoxin system VapC family toxin [Gandjariella thermophila]GDY30014.1 ribonuclease VapC [Gandjariella thermophila]